MTENEEIKSLLKEVSLEGSQAAYKELFMRLHERLKKFAYSILKSHEEAEELVSDIFIRIWQKRERLTEIESPRLYFYTTVKNLAFTRLSRQKREVSVSGDDWLVKMDSVFFDPEKLMMTEEIIRQIRQAVNELPPRCRLVFLLVKEDGLRYKEVAQLLHLSVKTIENQMTIALRRIGSCMQMGVNTGSLSLS
jgi:RNA polymerase sigma-70 factor (ECF subfamily)